MVFVCFVVKIFCLILAPSKHHYPQPQPKTPSEPSSPPQQHRPRRRRNPQPASLWPDGQYQMRIQAPECAKTAQPGSFVTCTANDHTAQTDLRRPLSIMRTSPEQGWIERLYKVVNIQVLAAGGFIHIPSSKSLNQRATPSGNSLESVRQTVFEGRIVYDRKIKFKN